MKRQNLCDLNVGMAIYGGGLVLSDLVICVFFLSGMIEAHDLTQVLRDKTYFGSFNIP